MDNKKDEWPFNRPPSEYPITITWTDDFGVHHTASSFQNIHYINQLALEFGYFNRNK